MKKLQLAIMATFLMLAAQAYATPIGQVSIGPGHSWDVTWNDGNYSGQFDTVVYDITSGNATFDEAATVNDITGTLLSDTESQVVVGPDFGSANTTMTLSFSDPAPLDGVQVSVLYYLDGTLLTGGGFNWEWLNLPADEGTSQGTDWQYLPVPDGGMTVSMLGLAVGACGLFARKMKKGHLFQ